MSTTRPQRRCQSSPPQFNSHFGTRDSEGFFLSAVHRRILPRAVIRAVVNHVGQTATGPNARVQGSTQGPGPNNHAITAHQPATPVNIRTRTPTHQANQDDATIKQEGPGTGSRPGSGQAQGQQGLNQARARPGVSQYRLKPSQARG
jgi:hypothetical protein